MRKQTQLYNYLAKTNKKLDKDIFIDVKKRDLHKIIEANPKWGDSNRMAFYYMISRFLDIKIKPINMSKSMHNTAMTTNKK